MFGELMGLIIYLVQCCFGMEYCKYLKIYILRIELKIYFEILQVFVYFKRVWDQNIKLDSMYIIFITERGEKAHFKC